MNFLVENWLAILGFLSAPTFTLASPVASGSQTALAATTY